jgi:hypothetical protein
MRLLRLDLASLLHKFAGLLLHLLLFTLAVGRADFFGDLHGAELGSAHGTEVGRLRAFVGQSLIVIFAGTLGVETQIELIFPTKLEACLGQGVVPQLSAARAEIL